MTPRKATKAQRLSEKAQRFDMSGPRWSQIARHRAHAYCCHGSAKQTVCAWGDPTPTKRKGETDTVGQEAPKSWNWELWWWGRGNVEITSNKAHPTSIPPVSHEALCSSAECEHADLPVYIKRLLFSWYPSSSVDKPPWAGQRFNRSLFSPQLNFERRLLVRHLWPFKPLTFLCLSQDHHTKVKPIAGKRACMTTAL